MKVAIVGASGLLGRCVVDVLKEKKIDCEIVAYTSQRSAGGQYLNNTFVPLDTKTICKADFAIFCAGSIVSKEWAKEFARLGCVVIDNSNAFRRCENVPLVVAEINASSIDQNCKIISNPNCSTIQIALPLFYLSQLSAIKRVVVSTYQSASGAGKFGLDDLDNGTTNKFAHILKDDLIPQIDVALDDGSTLEEDKICFELKKILKAPHLAVSATAVRVPIHYCHGASVWVEFENSVDVQRATQHLSHANGIIVEDDLKNNIYPLAKTATGKDEVFVGRLRKDRSCENGLCFWCVADNVRKGAATNAVQIMQYLIKQKNLPN